MDDRGNILRTLQHLETLYIPFSKATKLPFVDCDPETYDDQVYVYEAENRANEAVQKLNDDKRFVELVHLTKEAAGSFYMNLALMGVNAVVFEGKEGPCVFQLDQVVNLPELKNEEGKPIMINAELQLTIIYFMQQLRRPGVAADDPVRAGILKELEEEMMVRIRESTFIMPLFVNEEAKEGEKTYPQVRLWKINDQELQPVFTDMWECNRFLQMQKAAGKVRLVLVPFDNMEKALIQRATGYVVNSASTCLILSRKSLQK